MRVAVPKEVREGEKRVALVPDVIAKLTKLGYEVAIESGAGVHSQASDDLYRSAGAIVVNGDVLASADVILSVQPLTPAQMKSLKTGAVTISFLSPTASGVYLGQFFFSDCTPPSSNFQLTLGLPEDAE